MRIAIVTPVYPPYRGGIGTVAAGDARLLRAAGNDVAVVTPDCHRGARHDDLKPCILRRRNVETYIAQ